MTTLLGLVLLIAGFYGCLLVAGLAFYAGERHQARKDAQEVTRASHKSSH